MDDYTHALKSAMNLIEAFNAPTIEVKGSPEEMNRVFRAHEEYREEIASLKETLSED